MKTFVMALAGFVVLLVNFPGAARAQNNQFPRNALVPLFTNNPVALNLVTNLLNAPRPQLSVPVMSRTNASTGGTYWTLSSPAPLPADLFPELPVYAIGTNQYLIDDRSVDYATLNAEDASNHPVVFQPMGLTYDTNGLYIQVPTNSLATPNVFTVNVMNTIIGQSYDLLIKSDLLLPSWMTVLTTNAVASVTQVQVPRSSGNLFVWARESAGATFYINEPPVNQTVEDGDSVTFSVATGGNPNLTYQWTYNGVAIDGATNRSYTINNVQDSDGGEYAVTLSDGTNPQTASAQLTTDSTHPFGYTTTSDYNLIPILGSRQDYTFKSGNTYYISSQTTFYGKTVIEGGAVIKPDWYSGGSIQIMGTLDVEAGPYDPAIFTSVDDDSAGEVLIDPGNGVPLSDEDGPLFTPTNGLTYLDLTYAQTNTTVSNVQMKFADLGVVTPQAATLDVWDSQFFQCNYSIVNLANNGTDNLHNVLFAGGYAAVAATTNLINVTGEQVTADVGQFCLASATPSRIALTNSIYWGTTLSAASLSTVNVIHNPSNTNFTYEGYGNYYLAANSPLHHAGSAGISPRLQSELQRKTTYAPVPLAVNTTMSGDLTLSPQARRYTNGAPDIGYYYDALDYTVAGFTLAGGNLTILPDTAIAVRNEYDAADGAYSFEGFFVEQGSSITSQGTPTKPNVFTAEKLVQETPETDFAAYQNYFGYWFGVITFVTDSEPDGQNTPAAVYDFRFSKFYLPPNDYHFWSGYDTHGDLTIEPSPDSSMYLGLQDCQFQGGRIKLGNPDQRYYSASQVYPSGALTWINNSFENTTISLDPTDYRTNGVINCDLQLLAYNNLFKGGELLLEPFPASAGNWTFENNLFDKVDFLQDTGQPLNFDHNGYWPLLPREFLQGNSAGELAASTGGTAGGGEVTLSNAPPYQAGAFGKFYLPDTTPLYGAGGQSAADAGLYQYTTRLDQTKEGDETAGHMVNLGVHYVAANGNVPKDTDGDGVPDYVEDANGDGIVDFNAAENVNETDPNNPMTDGVTNDADNVAYDDLDLSGDGLVGRIKKALGMNPLDTSNPLTLKQIITGQEPDIATFEVPVSFNIATNIGQLQLLLDGTIAQFQECDPATNGYSLLKWNTTFDTAAQHYLAAGLTLNGTLSVGSDSAPDPTVLNGNGTLITFYSSNVCQFNPLYAEYDTNNGAYLYAKLPEPDADYSIELKTTNGVHIKTIIGNTSSDEINAQWDLTDDNGNVYTNGGDIDATFAVTLLDPEPTKTNHVVIHPQDPNRVWDANFTIAYATDDNSLATTAIRDCIQWSVVDTLLSPPQDGGGGSLDPYPSAFNDYSSPEDNGNPGYISGTNDTSALIANLIDPATRDFHFDGHGNPRAIGNNQNGASAVDVESSEIALKTGNIPKKSALNGLNRGHPFRYVFLNACETADSDDWHNAFGIYRRITTADLAKNPNNAQAFVGWRKSPRIPRTSDDWYDFASTYAAFYDAWMGDIPLDDCLDLASKKYPFGSGSPVVLNWPLNTKFLPIYTDTHYPYVHISDNSFHLKIYGYAGLMRHGYDSNTRHDSSHYYKN